MPKATYAVSFLILSVCSCLSNFPAQSNPTSNRQPETAPSAPLRVADRIAPWADKWTKPRLDRFEFAIKRFEEKDLANPPAAGAVVFVGSSTFTKWTDLERTFSDFKAINRGFGGSTIPEVNYYVSRTVTKYKPARVVFYAGSNDIAQLHHTGEKVYEDFKEFVKLVHEQLPDCDIYFVSMSVAPSRVQFERDFLEGNALIQSYIKSSPHLHYINVLPVMQDKDGHLRKELFGLDNLHMNADGYALWTPIIRASLKGAK